MGDCNCPISISTIPRKEGCISDPTFNLQKRIQKQVSVSSNTHTNALKAISTKEVTTTSVTTPTWHNQSDRLLSHGSSLHKNTGVDIKHNSYARYLAKKTANTYRSQAVTTNTPVYGNKIRKWSFLTSPQTTCM